MTSRQMYEATLIELNKTNAPNILLEDFNYFANKAINQYINKRYNIYDINQQTTDDLRVLKATAMLKPKKVNVYNGLSLAGGNMATFEVTLPSDYLHILNCICIYKVKKTYKCYNKDDTWRAAATRLTADAYSQVLDNFWNKPTYKRPYYYIHNVNVYPDVPTNPYNLGEGTDVELSPVVKSFVGSKKYITYNGSNYEYQPGTVTIVTDPTYYAGTYTLWSNGSNAVYYSGYYIGNVSINQGRIPDYQLSQLQSVSGISPQYESDKTYTFSRKESSGKYSWKNGSTTVYTDTRNPSNNSTYTNSYNDEYRIFSINTGASEQLDYWSNPIVDTSSINLFTAKSGTSNVERSAKVRYGNASEVRLEIRYGTDTSIFDLDGDVGGRVYIDYIKAPQNIRLTQEELDWTEDRSQMLEYPDYVCQEIVNELVHIIMENISDQRIQTHPVVSQSIANPAQQQTEPVAQQQS